MFSERLRRLELANNTVTLSEASRSSNLTVEDVTLDGRSDGDAPQSLGSLDYWHLYVLSAASYEFAGLGIGFARYCSYLLISWQLSMIAEVVLSHPFVVIRSQCQVSNGSLSLLSDLIQVRSTSTKLHLLPFSLLPVVSKCVQIQVQKLENDR